MGHSSDRDIDSAGPALAMHACAAFRKCRNRMRWIHFRHEFLDEREKRGERERERENLALHDTFVIDVALPADRVLARTKREFHWHSSARFAPPPRYS